MVENCNQEQAITYPVAIEASMYNERGVFYPRAYQQMAVGMLETHLERLEMDVPRLIRQYGMSWVLLSMSIELRRPLRPSESLLMRTWQTGHNQPLFRREFLVQEESGATVAVGTTFSALLDLNKRRICTDGTLLSRFSMPEGETLLEAQSRCTETPDFQQVEQRIVRPSWIDALGHVNNVRYGDFGFDSLSSSEQLRMADLRRMDIWFLSELKRGDVFKMEKAVSPDAVILRGVTEPDEKPSFLIKFSF